jgi:iron complex outermembrane receptor protein
VGGLFFMGANFGTTSDNCGTYFPPGSSKPCNNSWSQTVGSLFTSAAFVQGTYKIDDKTNLTGGLRYSWDSRTGESWAFASGTYNGPTGVRTISANPSPISFSDPTYRISLDHRFSDEVMAYVSFNHGFRSGQFGSLGKAATSTAPAVAATPISPEYLDAVEGGVKTDLLNRHLRIDAAAYYYLDHNRVSLQIINGTGYALNAKLATLYGADADAIWRFNDQFSMKAAVAAEHAVYSQFGNAACSGAATTGAYIQNCGMAVTPATGALLPQNNYVLTFANDSGHNVESTPDFTLSLGPSYVLPTSVGQFRSTLTYYYNDGWFAAPSNYAKQSPYSTVSAEILWTPSFNSHMSVRLWGANLTNTAYAEQYTETSPGPNYQVAPGRTYGITLTANY